VQNAHLIKCAVVAQKSWLCFGVCEPIDFGHPDDANWAIKARALTIEEFFLSLALTHSGVRVRVC
jgi:hypothetical protein